MTDNIYVKAYGAMMADPETRALLRQDLIRLFSEVLPKEKELIKRELINLLFVGVQVPIHVLPRGTMPERKSDGAQGFDCSIRALVHPSEMDSSDPRLRKPIFNFDTWPEDPVVKSHVFNDLLDGSGPPHGGFVYRLWPGEKVLAGVGFVIAMPEPMYHWVTPRSGLAAKQHITLENAPGTVDADYRGEAGALVINKGILPFDLYRGIRITQILFNYAVIPELVRVEGFSELQSTNRGSGGFGSTGND